MFYIIILGIVAGTMYYKKRKAAQQPPAGAIQVPNVSVISDNQLGLSGVGGPPVALPQNAAI